MLQKTYWLTGTKEIYIPNIFLCVGSYNILITVASGYLLATH